jgi:selenide,water dikinase
VEPIYGLAVIGLVHPQRVKRNTGARPHDTLILSKPLGVGILSAALKKGRLDDTGYRAMIDTTTRLNRTGARLAALADVHAMTDVTGFGLLGHTLELCRGAGLGAHIRYAELPWIDGVPSLAEAGVRTGASARNWVACGDHVALSDQLPAVACTLMTDPQTSGGLLVSCAADAAGQVLDMLRADGFQHATIIGEMVEGTPAITVL